MIATLPSSLIAAMPLAFAAGFVSFVSPCVLPLLPGYVAFLGGASGRLEGRSGRGRAVVGSLAFILGFSVVFVSLGALFGGLGNSFQSHQRPFEIAFGVVTIALGLFFGGWWPSSWLSRERRIQHLPRASVLGAAALGFTFGLGWTPCIGPTLGAILGLEGATTGATQLRGSILAFTYCLGLGVPFFVAALTTEWMAVASTWLRHHSRAIGRVGGLLLIAIGVAEVSGAWHAFVIWLQVHAPAGSTFL
ncbi:MAG TPA: cytochrome c biogenesis protein CcdA [Acidimicrobiales bacterium]|nr:cytochrome c biogenesis protein CcdA [Acidimicrobiales bacterium]